MNQDQSKKKEIRREKSNVVFHNPLVIDRQLSDEENVTKDAIEIKSVKSCQNTQEVVMNEEFTETRLASIEPKDISNKNQKAFESYLSQVSIMYFETGSNDCLQGLNELSSRVSNNQHGLQVEEDKGVARLNQKQDE